jgi:antitoxin (DNA-binding transcriptional repressor) of toxin-antitoxin stability system
MKVIGLKDTDLDACVSEAQHERIVITRNGKPVALVVGVKGLDAEQLEFGSDPAFWELIIRRRRQRTITRAELEEKIRQSAKRQSKATQHRVAPDAGSGAPEPVPSARKKRSRRRG